MESQISRSHGHQDDQQLPSFGLPSVIQGEDDLHDDHHEKKSVLKNVKEKAKAKAKKIKETLKHHGHGHEHDPDHHSHGEDEDEDDDKELVEDPEIHGAPIYESAAIRSDVGIGAGQWLGVNLEKPTVMAEDRDDSKITYPTTRPFAQWEEENVGQSEGQPRVKIGIPTAMEEDPNAPKDGPEPSNYQSKVDDPTSAGGKEAGITPILRSFNKMSVYDEPDTRPQSKESPNLYTGSHDQFSPEQLPASANVNPEDPGSALKAFKSSQELSDQSGYTGKISSTTSAIAEKALAAKNVVASKLGYGENTNSESSNTGGGEEIGISATVADYGHKVAATVTEKLAPVTEKVAGVSSSVLSKVQGSGTKQSGENKVPSRGVKEFLANKLRPSEEDKALSEVISDALHKRKQEAKEKPMGKVTVSEEVTRELGSSNEDPRREREGVETRGGINSSGAVVERVKGAVCSWFRMGKGYQSQSSQASLGTTYAGHEQMSSSASEAAGHAQDSAGERRLQESAN